MHRAHDPSGSVEGAATAQREVIFFFLRETTVRLPPRTSFHLTQTAAAAGDVLRKRFHSPAEATTRASVHK